MTIKDTETLNSILTALQKEIDCSISALSEKMSANEVNTIFNTLQSTLNSLYEKTRYIQDLRLYTQYYFKTQYVKKKNSFDAIMSLAENAANDYQDSKTIAKEIIFNVDQDTSANLIVKDRDGSDIEHIKSENASELLPLNEITKTPNVISITSSPSEIPYRQQITNNPEEYRSFYVLYEPHHHIDDTITILFGSPVELNYLNVQVFNSNISSIKMIADDNEQITILPDDNRVPLNKYKGVCLNITSDNTDPFLIVSPEFEDTESNLRKTIKTTLKSSYYDTYTDKEVNI